MSAAEEAVWIWGALSAEEAVWIWGALSVILWHQAQPLAPSLRLPEACNMDTATTSTLPSLVSGEGEGQSVTRGFRVEAWQHTQARLGHSSSIHQLKGTGNSEHQREEFACLCPTVPTLG